jgi:hypothetical protein
VDITLVQELWLNSGLKARSKAVFTLRLAPYSLRRSPFHSLLGDNHNLFQKTVTFTLCV